MKREQIEQHPAWKYISSLSPSDRYAALTGSNGKLAETHLNVTIEEWAFTRMNEIPADWMCISAIDPWRNLAMIMVLKPLES